MSTTSLHKHFQSAYNDAELCVPSAACYQKFIWYLTRTPSTPTYEATAPPLTVLTTTGSRRLPAIFSILPHPTAMDLILLAASAVSVWMCVNVLYTKGHSLFTICELGDSLCQALVLSITWAEPHCQTKIHISPIKPHRVSWLSCERVSQE